MRRRRGPRRALGLPAADGDEVEGSKSVPIPTLLSLAVEEKRLSKNPDIVERRNWYVGLRDTNRQRVVDELDLEFNFPDGQLAPWKPGLVEDIDAIADAAVLKITYPTVVNTITAASSRATDAVAIADTEVAFEASSQLSVKAAGDASAGFSTFMLDLAEESFAKAKEFERPDKADKVLVDVPIVEYDRALHCERGLPFAQKWLRPLNKRAKHMAMEVKSKLKAADNALRSGLGRKAAERGAAAGQSFARKPPSRVSHHVTAGGGGNHGLNHWSGLNHSMSLHSPSASVISEGGGPGPPSKARTRLLSIISSAMGGQGSQASAGDDEPGCGASLFGGGGVLGHGSTSTAQTADETVQTAHEGARKIVVCFPGMGCTPAYFLPWGLDLDIRGVELWAVCLPGRADRIREPFCESVHVAAGAVGDAMASLGLLAEQRVGHDLKRAPPPCAVALKQHSVASAGGSTSQPSVASLSTGAAFAAAKDGAARAWDWDRSSATGSCVALFGHSVGGVVAFETARYLRRTFGLDVPHLYVSCLPNPDWITGANREKYGTKRHLLPDDALLEKMADFGEPLFTQLLAARRRLLRLPRGDDVEWDSDLDSSDDEDEFGRVKARGAPFDLLALALPLARADFRLLETYAYEHSDDAAARRSGVYDKEDEYKRDRRRERERLQGVAVTVVVTPDDTILAGPDHLKASAASAAAKSSAGARGLLRSGKKASPSSRTGTVQSGRSGTASRGDISSSRRSRHKNADGGGFNADLHNDSDRGDFADLFSPADATAAAAAAPEGGDFLALLGGLQDGPETATAALLGGGTEGPRAVLSRDYVDACEDWRLQTMMSAGAGADGSTLRLERGSHHRCLLQPENQAVVLSDLLVKLGAAVPPPDPAAAAFTDGLGSPAFGSTYSTTTSPLRR